MSSTSSGLFSCVDELGGGCGILMTFWLAMDTLGELTASTDRVKGTWYYLRGLS